MTENPYTPPSTQPEIAPALPEKSIARRISLGLAATGLTGFWGTLIVCAIIAVRADRVPDATAVAMGVAIVLSVVVHIVGVTIAFAAVPEGRRVLPTLLNAIPLALILGLVVFSLKTPI